MLNARVEALGEVDQLRLATETTACKAVLDWTQCKLASSLAIKDLSSPLVRQATERSGGCHLIQLGGPGTPAISEGIIVELSLALSCSERAARDYVAVGLDLRFRLRCTSNDFGGGRITYAHALVISESTRCLSAELAERLDDKLSEAAQTRTPARLKVLARRLVAKADPAGLARRHTLAMSERSASVFPIGDGMAAFSFNHELDVAVVIDDQLTSWARQRRAAESTTPFAAHRADAAALLLLGRHPLTGADLLRRPGGDNAVPLEQTPGEGVVRASGPQIGLVSPSPAEVLPTRTEIRLTMGADTLLGLDDETCELDGFGPITAEQARRLALRSHATTFRRLFTDPADSSVMAMDANTYRFTQRQTEAIRALHPISCFPGATTAAGSCDVDHRRPYRFGPPGRADPPGQTLVANGQPLGRRNHRVRTHLRWVSSVADDDPHTITWTTPHGLDYVVHDHEGA